MEPTSAALARRVQTLRKLAGLTQTQLAERMTALGADWGRTTVAKVEGRTRESVSVGEWLALARVFDVPPVWLIADLESGAPVPIARDLQADPWPALLWMIGQQPLDPSRPPGARMAEAMKVLALVGQLANDLTMYRLSEQIAVDDDMRDTQHRHVLQQMRLRLAELSSRRLPPFQIPADIVQRARKLGVELPGQEG